MQRTITNEGNVIAGEELRERILGHYAEIHNKVRGIEKTKFPDMRFTDEEIIGMARNVNKGKGIAFDGVADSFFQLRRDCWKEDLPCTECTKKVGFLREYLSASYWNEENT